MKRYFPILGAALLLVLPSCRFIRVSDEFKKQMKEQGVNYNAGQDNGRGITASDIIASREEQPGDFSSLICNLPGDMTYLPGECAVSLSGPDNVLEHISVINDEGQLTIKSDGINFRNLKKLKIVLSAPEIENMDFNGAVDFEAPLGITAPSFSVTVNGACDINIKGLKTGAASITVNGAGDITVKEIESESLAVEINGAGDATVEGRTGKADLNIRGAGNVDARGLVADEFNSKVRGAGSIRRPLPH